MEKFYGYHQVDKEIIAELGEQSIKNAKDILWTNLFKYLSPRVELKYNIYEESLPQSHLRTFKIVVYTGEDMPKFCEGERIRPNLDEVTLDLFSLQPSIRYVVTEVYNSSYYLIDERYFNAEIELHQCHKLGREFVRNNFVRCDE